MDRNIVRNSIQQTESPVSLHASIAFLVQQTIAGITPHWIVVHECWMGTIAGLEEGRWRQA
jgi:hypothetical protein